MRFSSYGFFNPSTPEGLRGFSFRMEVLLDGGGGGGYNPETSCAPDRPPGSHPSTPQGAPHTPAGREQRRKFTRVVIPLNLLQLPEREVDQEQMVD